MKLKIILIVQQTNLNIMNRGIILIIMLIVLQTLQAKKSKNKKGRFNLVNKGSIDKKKRIQIFVK